jgi:hypothetical protein
VASHRCGATTAPQMKVVCVAGYQHVIHIPCKAVHTAPTGSNFELMGERDGTKEEDALEAVE